MAAPGGTRAAGWMMAAGAALSLLGVALFALAGLDTTFSPSWSGQFRGLAMAGGGRMALAGFLVGLLGLALYVLIPAFSGRGRALRDYGSHRVVLACTVLAAVIGNLLAGIYFVVAPTLPLPGLRWGYGSGLPERLLSPQGIAVAAVSLDLALLAVVYLRIVRPGAISWKTMGLSTRGLPGRILLGLLCGMPLFGVSSLLELLLGLLGIQQTQGLVFRSVTRASPGEFGLVLLAGALVAPIVEEIYFRGYVFRAYLDQKGALQAFLFSAGLFALVHLNLPALLPIFAVGLLLSFIYHRTGSIIPAMVAHSVNNAVAFTLLYLGLS